MQRKREDSLYRQKKYNPRTSILIGSNIVEYDISQANISVLADAGIIDQQAREFFRELPKLDREITIGRMIRDGKINQKDIDNGIINAKIKFMESNGFTDDDIFSIDNDSISIINKPIARNLAVGNFTSFRVAEQWNSYIRLKNSIQLFYFYNPIDKIEKFRAKGLGSASPLHDKFMNEFLKELFYTAQTSSIKDALNIIYNFYNKYQSRSLDVGFYRSYDARSYYKLNIKGMTSMVFYAENVASYQMEYVDISYNEGMLRDIYSLLSGIFFN